jgi:diacylglycerol O-acyltransferase
MEPMSPLDASFLYLENDVTPLHIGGVAVFEGPRPTRYELVSRIEAKLAMVPRYRQKVRFLPLNVGRPGWVDDAHFNIEYHVRRTGLPAPGGRAELDNLVGRVMSQHLDRARPLWEMWAVEGLEEGRWAMVSKVHHCMVDGVSSTDLMSVVFDADAVSPPVTVAPWQPGREPTAAEMLAQSLAGALSPIGQLTGLLGALRSPQTTLRSTVDTVRVLTGMATRLLPPRPSSLTGSIGPHRRWTSAHASLADLKLARRALGGTVNDVVLTAITRGFRDLLISRGELGEGKPVRTLVPVSVRAENERGTYNNRVSAVFVDLPVGLQDPLARLAGIRSQMDGIKAAKGALAGDRLASLSGFAPPMLLAAGQRLAAAIPQQAVHTGTTNVPGPQHPLYFAGRRLLESSPFVPLLASVRTVIGIFSYDGGVHFGITGDYDSVPDIDVLRHGIESGVAELAAAALAAQSAGNGAAGAAARSDRAGAASNRAGTARSSRAGPASNRAGTARGSRAAAASNGKGSPRSTRTPRTPPSRPTGG